MFKRRAIKAGPHEAISKFQILKKDEDGFLLVVTNPRIDSAHDATQASRAMSETVALDIAVEEAMEAMGDKLDETLILITADHSNTMTISGYPDRGADIAGWGPAKLASKFFGQRLKTLSFPFSLSDIF